MPVSKWIATVLAVVMLMATGCTSSGPADNPVSRAFTWYSYLNGDDIRRNCEVGGADRYRMVYNGIYGKQVRAYDLKQAPGGGDGILETRVFAGQPLSTAVLQVLGKTVPGEGMSRTRLTLPEIARIERALLQAGLEQPTTPGMELHSDSFYWLVMACRQGRFDYQALSWPGTRIEQLPLFSVLLPHDGTGVAVHAPRTPVYPPEGSRPQGRGAGEESAVPYFRLEVGRNGLVL
jgi:hypothetical protein